jgi:hypothetical protein
MTTQQFAKGAGAIAAVLAIGLAGMMISAPQGQAQNGGNGDESRIQQGFAIAPVPLTLAGKNRALVGLGSYIVNAVSDCNACHNAGPGNNQFLGGNPFFGQPKMINRATYLGGWPGFRSASAGRFCAHYLPQSDTGQNRAAGRGPYVCGVCSNHEKWCGHGPPPSDVCWRHQLRLRAASVRW